MSDVELAIAVLVRHLSEDPRRWTTPLFEPLRRLVSFTTSQTEPGSSSDEEEEMPPGDSYELARDYARDAMHALETQDNDKALECADAALALNPDSVKALRARAIALFRLNKSKEAYQTMCDAQRLDFDEEYTLMHDQMRQAAMEGISPSAPPPVGFAGLPMPAGVESLMQNPQVMAMAQNMMQNPDVMRNMMHMFKAPDPRPSP